MSRPIIRSFFDEPTNTVSYLVAERSHPRHRMRSWAQPGRVAARAWSGRVVGADPSELMVEIAARRNRPLIEAARVDVVLAGVESLPFADDFFDKVLCVHVVYFWKDIDVSLREVVRVLRPGGRLALLFRTKADQAALASFPPEIYRFPELAEVTAACERTGLAIHPASDSANEPVLLVAERRRALDGT